MSDLGNLSKEGPGIPVFGEYLWALKSPTIMRTDADGISGIL